MHVYCSNSVFVFNQGVFVTGSWWILVGRWSIVGHCCLNAHWVITASFWCQICSLRTVLYFVEVHWSSHSKQFACASIHYLLRVMAYMIFVLLTFFSRYSDACMVKAHYVMDDDNDWGEATYIYTWLVEEWPWSMTWIADLLDIYCVTRVLHAYCCINFYYENSSSASPRYCNFDL